jgi:dihydroflavonol-4-reductase
MGVMLDQFLSGKMPLIPFPDLGICLTHVEDIAGGIILGLDKGRVGEAYIISGPVTTVRGAIEVVAGLTGKKAPKHALPTGLMKALVPIGRLVGKLMGQQPNLRELIASADGVTFWATYEKAAKELGYEPRGLEEGLRAMLAADGRLPAGATA